MLRYFIHIQGDDGCVYDEVGSHHPNLRSVHASMIRRMASIALNSDATLTADGAWSAEALDDRGRIVATVTVGLEKP